LKGYFYIFVQNASRSAFEEFEEFERFEGFEVD